MRVLQSKQVKGPIANELMNSLMRKWFRLLIQQSIHNLKFIFSLDSIIECLFDYCFFKNYPFHKSTSEFCFFSSFFLRVECGRVLKFKPKQTVKCMLFCCQWSVQETWPLRKQDGQTEVSVCAVIGGFRSSAFVSFFAFAVYQFWLLFWLKARKNAIVNGRKGKQIRLNTTEKNNEQVDFVHKLNQHIIESRSNLIIGLFILWVNYWIDKPNHFSIHDSDRNAWHGLTVNLVRLLTVL